MTLRKYLFSIALLFLIPALALAAMGNGLAWAFGIIAGMLILGALGCNELLSQDEENILDEEFEESSWSTNPANPAAGVAYEP